MPRVPVSTAPLPGVRVGGAPSPESYGAGVGDTLIHLGRDAYQKEVDAADRTAAFEADTDAADLQLDLQNRASQVQGKDVLGLDDQVKTQWDEGIGKITQRLADNPRVLSAFTQRASQRALQLRDSVQRHTNAQINQFYDQEADAGLSSALDVIRSNPDSPLTFKNETQRMKSIIAAQAVRKGWAGTVTDEMMKQPAFYQRYADRGEEPPMVGDMFFTDKYHSLQVQALSTAHREVVTGLVDRGDDLAASHYFKMRQQEFTAKDRDVLEPTLQEGSTRGEARRQTQSILDTHGMDTADQRRNALKAADGIENVKVADLTRQRLEHLFAAEDQRKGEAYTQTFMNASKMIDETGKQSPDQSARDMLPVSLWQALRPEQQHSLDLQLERLRTPGKITHDPMAWAQFSAIPEAKLATMKLEQVTAALKGVDNQHFDHGLTLWRGATNKLTGQPDDKTISMLTNHQRAENAFRLSGIVPPDKIDNPKHWPEGAHDYHTLFMDQADKALSNLPKDAKPDQVDKVLNELVDRTLKQKFSVNPGVFGFTQEYPAIAMGLDRVQKDVQTSKRTFVPLNQIPQAAQDQLRGAIQANHWTPTDDKIERGYWVLRYSTLPRAEKDALLRKVLGD